MKKEKNKQVQNYRIVILTLLMVVFFLLFAMNEFKMPSVKKKTSDRNSKVVSDLNEQSKNNSKVIPSSNQRVGDAEGENFEEQQKGKNEDVLLTVEEKKRILSEYSMLSEMAEGENRKLKISFVRYLEAYERKEGSPEDFFEEWKEKYQQDKDSISRQKTEIELDREEKARGRARALIEESEKMTLTECQKMADKYGITLEDVLTLREGQIKIMKYAL